MKHYTNLDLELFDHRIDGAEERFSVRVTDSPAGEMPFSEAVPRSISRGLRASIQSLEDDRLDKGELIELGGRLGELLLPVGPVRQLFEQSRGKLKPDQGLRLRLRIEDPELSSLPWELTYLPLPGLRAEEGSQGDTRGFLALQPRLSLVRHELLPAPVAGWTAVPQPRLVCMLSGAASPGLGSLDLAEEQRSIQSATETAGIEMVALPSATLAGLQTALDDGAHLFHYGGHGQFDERMGEIPRTSEGEAYLLLEDASGRLIEVPAEQVGQNLAAANIRLAVLNGCETGRRDAAHSWTGIAPALAQQGIPAVLAHQFKVSDKAAIELSRRFYEKLVTGSPVDAALSAARLALNNLPSSRPRDFATPVLYLRLADDSDGVLLPRPPPGTEITEKEAKPNRWFWANLLFLVLLCAGLIPWLASRYLGWDLLVGTGAGVVTLLAAWGIIDRLVGEHLNAALRAWLRKPVATIWLVTLLATGGLAAALAPAPSPVILLLPYDGVISLLPGASTSRCTLRLTVDGEAPYVVSGLWRQAVFLAASEKPVTERIADGALTKALLAMRPAGEHVEQRRHFYDTLIERRRIEPLRLNPAGRLRLEIVEHSDAGVETVLFADEKGIADLEGDDVRVWFLKGGSP